MTKITTKQSFNEIFNELIRRNRTNADPTNPDHINSNRLLENREELEAVLLSYGTMIDACIEKIDHITEPKTVSIVPHTNQVLPSNTKQQLSAAFRTPAGVNISKSIPAYATLEQTPPKTHFFKDMWNNICYLFRIIMHPKRYQKW